MLLPKLEADRQDTESRKLGMGTRRAEGLSLVGAREKGTVTFCMNDFVGCCVNCYHSFMGLIQSQLWFIASCGLRI